MGKVGNLLNIAFDSEPVYGDVDKHIKKCLKKMLHINAYH